MNPASPNLLGIRPLAFLLIGAFCLSPWANPPLALLLGFLFSFLLGHPFPALQSKVTSTLLKVSVVGLGFGMNVSSAIQASKDGVLISIASIVITLVLGFVLGKALRIPAKTAHLVASGTAICGGSAIAAIGPVVNASENEMSVSLGTVFLLNSIALFLFPFIGRQLQLTQHEFGLWSAIAIHDTSSVVGAASAYGQEALQTATTVKLARALWIIPLAFGTALFFSKGKQKVSIPWFIGFFVLAMLCNTYLPVIHPASPYLVQASRAGLTLTLFLIGAGLSPQKLKAVGWKPLLLGVLLWLVISTLSLGVITRLT